MTLELSVSGTMSMALWTLHHSIFLAALRAHFTITIMQAGD